MNFLKYLFAGISVGGLSVIYNFFVFRIFNFYPDFSVEWDFLQFFKGNYYYILIFFKSFVVGIILMLLFSAAYKNIIEDMGEPKKGAKAIFFFILYSIFALLAFSIGDIFLLRTYEGMFVLVTIDGFLETIIATIPVRLFYLGK